MTALNKIMDIDEIKDVIKNLYHISEPFDCTFIRRSFNDHYLIETKNNRYILRVYLNNKYYIDNINNFHYELDLLSFLRSKKLPVSYPIRNKDEEFLSNILLNTEIRFIALFSFAEGTPIGTTLKKNLAMSFGKTIANLHQTSNEFKSNHDRYKIDFNYLIKEPMEMLRTYSIKHELENLDFFMPYENHLYNKLQELPVNSTTYGIIHGDLNPSNIHVDAKGTLTMFDFDHCSYGWRIHDLAVIKLCYDTTTYEAILDGYILQRTLSTTETDLINLYSKALIIRKYKDILSMLKISNNDTHTIFNEKDFLINAIDTLHRLISQ